MNDYMLKRKYAFKQGDIVDFTTGIVTGRGKICGISSNELPVIGTTYVVEVIESNIDKDVYPFTHIPVFEINLTRSLFKEKK